MLKIEKHNVRVTINNGVALTEVTQVFRNTEKRQVEALYMSPVPKGASVANFSMWLGGRASGDWYGSGSVIVAYSKQEGCQDGGDFLRQCMQNGNTLLVSMGSYPASALA